MASLIFAILGFVFVLIGLVPLFGWLNWRGISFSSSWNDFWSFSSKKESY